MNVAHTIAKRGYDPRLMVGTVIVSDDNTQMLSCGYNGNYKGGPNVRDSLEPGQGGLIHAEVNALVKLDFNFPKGKHMYVTHSPCKDCAKLIINAGITRVVYQTLFREPDGLELLCRVGLEVLTVDEAILMTCEAANRDGHHPVTP